jgi:uncharacterized protein YndB with AHSA1/START domain
MALDSLRLIAILPASPADLYAAWLDSREHSEFTGDTATIEPGVGGAHSAWGGYIMGRHVELEPGKRIVQTWRTTEFPDDAIDSRLELVFEPKGDGSSTTLTLIHTHIPAGQGAQYKDGWGEHYFEPMRAYFRERGTKKPAAPKTAARAAAAPANAAAKKPAVTKVAAKKAAPKKAAPKKAAPKKAAPKKAAPKKAAPGKGAAKKAPAKKAAKKSTKKSR